MGFFHRKLFPTNITDDCEEICKTDDNYSCTSYCLNLCPNLCVESKLLPPPPPPTHKSHKPSTFLTITIGLLAASFILVCGYVLYVKYYSNRRRSTEQQSEAIREEFIDEEHAPVVDHPIWYIRTVGLEPSIINSITVLKYKKGDGLIEGTDCSVCLSEFQEDETLRLLPKCSHAFHIPCIDTWLRSHTNCPMCRAPIIVNTVSATALPEPSVVNSSSEEEIYVGNSDNNGEVDRETEDEVCELRVETEEEGENSNREVGSIQPGRRSVSFDSLSAPKISLYVSKVTGSESEGNSDKQSEVVNKLSFTKRVEENQKLQRLEGSSSRGRSVQREAASMKRSSSYSGKFGFRRQSKSSDSVLPLRSF